MNAQEIRNQISKVAKANNMPENGYDIVELQEAGESLKKKLTNRDFTDYPLFQEYTIECFGEIKNPEWNALLNVVVDDIKKEGLVFVSNGISKL